MQLYFHFKLNNHNHIPLGNYEQQFVRTMFFPKCDEISYDGNFKELSNNVKNEMFYSRTAIIEIYNYLDPENMAMSLDFNNYA